MSEETETVEPVENEEQVEGATVADDATSEESETEGDFDRERVLNKLRKINQEVRDLKKTREDSEKKVQEAEGKTEQIKALEAANARYETLADNDLPLKLAKWISATEADEILEQAEELLSLGTAERKTPPSDTPKETGSRPRRQEVQGDEIGNLDDFAKQIYSQ